LQLSRFGIKQGPCNLPITSHRWILDDLDLVSAVGDASAMAARENILIIGAGLSGLSAASGLKKGYRLIERSDRPGGLCVTDEDRGFRFDRTGHLLHLNSVKIRRLVESALSEEPLQIERKARIFSQGVFTHYPFQANTYGLPKEVIAECLTGFIEAGSNKAKGRPVTFEEFIVRHFGHGIARHFMIPYNTKLWGVHPRDITAYWCKRFVPIPKVEEVVAGAVGLAQEKMGYNSRFLYPSTGIQELPMGLLKRVSRVEYNTAPKAIDFRRCRARIGGEWAPYRAVVSTIPLKNLVRLLVDPPPGIAKAADRLKCSSLRYLDIALNRPAGNEYHWSYVPERRYPFYRVGCYSNFSKKMAPPRKSNLYVEMASRSQMDMPQIMPKVAGGLIDMGLIEKKSDIDFVVPRRLPHAYVIYDASYERTVPKLLAWLDEHRIFCAGRYARWEYSAMEDALTQGIEAADKVKELD
jgi:protoporphyrinogen oxidase